MVGVVVRASLLTCIDGRSSQHFESRQIKVPYLVLDITETQRVPMVVVAAQQHLRASTLVISLCEPCKLFEPTHLL